MTLQNPAAQAQSSDAPFALISHELGLVDQVIREHLDSPIELVSQVAAYIVDSGGKRARPALVILSAKAMNPNIDPQRLALAGAMIEFIHTATLLHDDVVDHSAWRRGKPSAPETFGNAASVLVGDFLYSRAFQMMVALDNSNILALMAESTNAIAEGEVLQLMHSHQPDTTEAQYFEIIERKTATLFAAAACVGAWLTEQPQQRVQQMQTFGLELGLAFQLTDDWLDLCGQPEHIGKSLGDDLAEGIPTLPMIYAMQLADQPTQTLIRQAIEQGESEHIEPIIQSLKDCGALEKTAEQAQLFADRACNTLSSLDESPYQAGLMSLAQLAAKRQA